MPTKNIEYVKFVKENLGMVSSAIAVVTAIVVSVISIESRYAHAQDVKELVRNQGEQIKLMNQNSARNLMFQLEYYDNAIKQRERLLLSTQSQVTRLEITREIDDLKMKREFVRKQIIDSK